MSKPISIPDRPQQVTQVPTMRYWGDRKPPKNRADMFRLTVNAADGAGDVSTGTDTAQAGSVATLRMYGPIDSWGGWWGISAQDVAQALDSLGEDVTEVRVRINSPGGEAWEGMAILNLLRAHKARIVAVVDGIAASASSYIACGVDETVMSPGTQLMIHDASTFDYGNAADMRKAAEFLDSLSNSIASLYTEAAGGTDEAWRALMVEETWYTATEAVSAGLADRVGVVSDAGTTATAGDDTPDPLADGVEDQFDLRMYNHAGRSQAPAPKLPNASASGSTPPAAPAPGDPTKEGQTAVADITDEQLNRLRQAGGVPEGADLDTALDAIEEALEERADDTPQNATVPAGHVVVPEARLRDLETAARSGVDAAERLRVQDRKEFLDSVRTKFAPANRKAWEAEYDRDPKGTRDHFAAAPDIIPLAEFGHADNPDAAESAQDSLMESVGWGEPKRKED